MTAAVAGYARSFDPAPASVREARRFVVEALAGTPFDAVCEPASLLASELVTNAVLHARTPFTVEVQVRAERVRVTVQDRSPAMPARRKFSDLAGSGRGLHLVDSIADRWGIQEAAAGKSVWFELTLTGEGALIFDLDAVEPI